MVRWGTALAILISSTSHSSSSNWWFSSPCQGVNAFHHGPPNSLNHVIVSRRRAEQDVQRQVASSSSSSEFTNPSSGGETLTEALSTVTNAARDTIVNAVRDEPDSDEARIALKQKQVQGRTKTYIVTLPLPSLTTKIILDEQQARSQVLAMGMCLCQVSKGREFQGLEMDLDSLNFLKTDAIEKQDTVERLDEVGFLSRRITGEFQGLVVSAVRKDGAAWAAGVRPGDIVKSTSATMGSQRWPKSSLEGIRSVIQSRKAVSGSIQFEFQRLGEALDNQFELTLTRPIGLELKETQDGYVEVVGFTENAPTLVQYAVKVGDRVLSVDSSMGERMWPVSTVEGVISAVTSRLPGQQITFRFERPGDVTVSNEPVVIRPKMAASAVAPSAIKDEELLRRCRDVIRRYTGDGQATKDKFVSKYSVPSLVADKVMDALASASATMDAITLSMVMNAYLSCRQPKKAIEVFEAAVGICADGSRSIPSAGITGKNDGVLGRSTKALDIYTAGSLLKAHAMNGDHSSVRRVLAALSGRDDSAIDGLEVGSWPGTGTNGILKPNTRCYNIAISALADSAAANSLDLAMQIFDVMPEQGRKIAEVPVKSLVTYNTMINAFTNNGRYEEALDLFYRMKRAGVTPDKFSYTSLVKAIVNMSEGDIDEFLYDMKEQGAVADSIFYNTIIKTLCEQKKINAAKKIIVEMESAGVSPDSMTYGMLMKGLIETGNPRAALTLFETACCDRRTVALTENVYLYTTAISAAASVADHQRALELLSRMNGLGISPTLKTMTALVGACLASGTPDLAYDIFKRIQLPDGYALLQGIKALCESGRLQEAMALVDGKESKILSGKQVMDAYESLLQNSLKRDDFDSARMVIRQLLKSGNIPSKAIYETIYESLNLFPKKRPGGLPPVVHMNEESAGKFQFLLFVLDSVKSRNLPCEGPLYSATLSFGSQLGGLPRKIAKLLVAARSVVKESGTKEALDDPKVVSSWVELYTQYDSLSSGNDLLDCPSKLPFLNVRVNAKDISKVLRAENGLSFTKRKPRRKEI